MTIEDEAKAAAEKTKRGVFVQGAENSPQNSDALAYVDKSLDNVADLDPDLTWRNVEVIEMLEEIRSMILTDKPLPGLFAATHENEGTGQESHEQ